MPTVILKKDVLMKIKLKSYKFDKQLTTCKVSTKIDGVQAIYKDGEWLSRAGKPLYNLPQMPEGVYEVFLGSWELSVSAVRTQIDGTPVSPTDLYSLFPEIDKRLEIHSHLNEVCPVRARELLNAQLADGAEGVCIKCDQGWFKIKPVETYDVPVVGVQPGTGKHLGKMGALITPMGKVGTGFSDAQREELAGIPMGCIIEVECMSLTPGGKFRHPRFIRIREDKV